MPRAQNKTDLVTDTKNKYEELITLINHISETDRNALFLFSDRDKNIRDVIMHLYYWHEMFFAWYNRGLDQATFKTPSEKYSWKETKLLNQDLWQEAQKYSLDEALTLLDKAYQENLNLLISIPESILFTRGYYKWTKTSHLALYFISNGPSHYEWAIKKIKKHLRELKNGNK
ncbi:conserved hypothetical protein (DUF1706) [Alteracholeplasma palmae J233]|uniref:ClbS/DfsB family four-helix bundle protein n=1 Tax=Alteracholeplasma palmae (strain ATCC 49389 / J233) TaxID=1318466 RepID=U4KNU1_ALTPJ|nr:ClbS/DfsB family four-helix bundle protein [Alteracholeplasma palmae]CCV63880.1 conserved hypothetical protein (DUF1706) [Alteracholeplasma palmae J233]